jgi:histone acetyltransferase (RNA polymerase elongator complex component)
LEDIYDLEADSVVDEIPPEGQLMEQTPPNQNIDSRSSTSTLALQKKRKLIKAPLVVSEVRRSERIKKQNLSFKASSCPTKSCIYCNSSPPFAKSHNPQKSCYLQEKQTCQGSEDKKDQ